MERFEQQALAYLSYVQQQRHVDLSRLSDYELAVLLESAVRGCSTISPPNRYGQRCLPLWPCTAWKAGWSA